MKIDDIYKLSIEKGIDADRILAEIKASGRLN